MNHYHAIITLYPFNKYPIRLPMYVESVKNRNSPPAVLVRESYWQDGKCKKRTLANLSKLPPSVIAAVRAELKNSSGAMPEDFDIIRTLPHGHVAAVLGTMKKLALERLIDAKSSNQRQLCLAMIAARIIAPGSKLATCRGLWTATATDTLSECLNVADADWNDLYAAMDWLLERQDLIERKLARRHLAQGSLVMYDLTSTWVCGEHCELAEYGYSRDNKKGAKQIEFGLLCEAGGRPVAIEAFAGNTSDPDTVISQVNRLRKRFGLSQVVMVGDRGMLTAARIEEDLKPAQYDWITTIKSTAIRQLVDNGELQPSLFDERDLGEIRCEELYPRERLVVCRNPLLADKRRKSRADLLQATEKSLDEIVAATKREKHQLKKESAIWRRVTRALDKHKMRKHFEVEVAPETFRYRRNQASIDREAVLDGFYVIRTSVGKDRLSVGKVVDSYKRLSKVERAFRSMKTVDLKVRPIYHRRERRVRAHLLLCMLAYYVEFEMRQNLAPLLFDDEYERPLTPSPARRSPSAERKAKTKLTTAGEPVHSFQTLMKDLATLCRVRVRPMKMKKAEYWMLAQPTEIQQKAMDLLGVKANII